MTTLSIPVSDQIKSDLSKAIAAGYGSNYADIARNAIKKYLEALAVDMVLMAQQEPSLDGDLDELASQL